VENLAHSASFHRWPHNAPSNPGTKHLRDADPIRAAIHLLALIEFDARDWLLYGDASVTPAMIEEQIHQGVDAFLRAYASNG
jgi:hypothetical protein